MIRALCLTTGCDNRAWRGVWCQRCWGALPSDLQKHMKKGSDQQRWIAYEKAVALSAICLLALLAGCAAVSPRASDPYLHSEEPSLAAWCAQHRGEHRGTCP